MSNLYNRFLDCFTPRLAEPFIVRPDGSTIRYADLHAATGRIANLLVSLGIGRGDRIAMQVDKSAEGLLVYLATLRIGAIHLPLNPAYTPRELDYFLRDAEPALFVCSPANEPVLGALCREAGIPNVMTLGAAGDGSLLAAAGAMPENFATMDVAGDELAAILYTSGTTGRSKGAMLTHDNLGSNAETLRSLWRFESGDVLLHALPTFHTHGLFVATNIILLAGARMIFLPAFDLDAMIRLLPQSSVLMGVPTFYSRLLSRSDFTSELVKDMRLFVSGSAPLSAEVHREFSARTGHAILERYGMTETNMNSSNSYDGARVPGSVGFPLPGVDIRITDAQTAKPLPQGEIGMIEVRGANVFAGYWRMPEKTAEEKRADGFFITGDVGRFDEAGYLFISGREKDLIISGGLNVYPAEVEALIDELPGVAECAVIGVPHPDLGEGVVAVIAAKAPGAVDAAAVKAALADTLASFKRPKHIILVDQLPRNAMGKIQKAELRRIHAETIAGRAALSAR
ncbi:MAG: AMP-dependent synthetase and ligase [Sphingomonas bacterium]|uniref:malonate--CoA ligase n=1 Tax=Sphingomonas bacterium TaxID=1895847 RepID=UPI00262D9264|nr:malonyl-CoA synthase [Sphingomonas bacterium]MDB5703880.1 AMP-dependent synthetase and ligase [Sphingomonas bacterium]